jgi:uncharacterized protein
MGRISTLKTDFANIFSQVAGAHGRSPESSINSTSRRARNIFLNMPTNAYQTLAVLFSVATIATGQAQTTPNRLLLKDYRPRSIYKIPETRIDKARFPAIDVHAHVYTTNRIDVDRWVRMMDDVGLARAIILSGSTGVKFDSVVANYGRHPKRFALWCGIDFSEFDQPGFPAKAVAELERCHKAGARGIGELSDKGRGLSGAPGMHCDDARMDDIFEKCADLRMPVNIHVGEDQWMYEPMDETNDGLMNGFKWKIPTDPAVLRHDEVLRTLENAVRKHPRTTFIACHFANCCADLNRLGQLLDTYPNLNADMAARFAEISPIPRFMGKFFAKYQDRLLYGTDNTFNDDMYRTSFRILESEDEHFYPTHFRLYHWPLHGFGLPDGILKKIYRENALRIIGEE